MTIDDARKALRDAEQVGPDGETRDVIADVEWHADKTQNPAWRVANIDDESFIITAIPNPTYRDQQPPAHFSVDGHLWVDGDGSLHRCVAEPLAATVYSDEAEDVTESLHALRASYKGERRVLAIYPGNPSSAADLGVEVTEDKPNVGLLVGFKWVPVAPSWAAEAAADRKSPSRVQRFVTGTDPSDYQAFE